MVACDTSAAQNNDDDILRHFGVENTRYVLLSAKLLLQRKFYPILLQQTTFSHEVLQWCSWKKSTPFCYKRYHSCYEYFYKGNARGGVEDTRLDAKAQNSLSEDRPFRGQGQECSRARPRTKDTGTSVLKKKKKVFKFFFQAFSNSIGVPRIFDLGRLKPQITCNDVIKIFSKRQFLWNKDIVGWKIWNCCLLVRDQDLAKEEGLKGGCSLAKYDIKKLHLIFWSQSKKIFFKDCLVSEKSKKSVSTPHIWIG